jgi:hypothetical protein
LTEQQELYDIIERSFSDVPIRGTRKREKDIE